MNEKLEEFLPLKTVKFSDKDKKWINAELKKVDRLKKRERCKNGKSDKYFQLKAKFDAMHKEAVEKHVTELMNEGPGKAYATLKRMGAKPGDNLDDASFSILNHLEQNLTNKQSVDKLAEHFCKISQQFPALSVAKLSQPVRQKSENRKKSELPYISRWAIEKMLKKSKKSKTGIEGDLPKLLIDEFYHELAEPLTFLYNDIIQTGNWPEQWKVEFGLPLKKVAEPVSEDDLRIISLTPLYRKVFEKFVMEWIP